jgi:hypothetical protein
MKKIILITVFFIFGISNISKGTTPNTMFAKIGIWGGENSIVVLVDTFDNGTMSFDNMVDIAFVLQTEGDNSNIAMLFYAAMRIVKYENVLIIENESNKFILHLSDVDIGAFSSNSSNTELYEGFGLAEIAVRNYNMPLTFESADSIIIEYIAGSGGGNSGEILAGNGGITGGGGTAPSPSCSNCAAGGPGASSCSKSGEIAGMDYSCSITCNAGYYACCAACTWCKCCTNKKNLVINNEVKVYPNPADSEINVQISNIIPNCKANIYELYTGKLIRSININNYNTIVNINDFTNGCYLFTCYIEGELYSTIFVKE